MSEMEGEWKAPQTSGTGVFIWQKLIISRHTCAWAYLHLSCYFWTSQVSVRGGGPASCLSQHHTNSCASDGRGGWEFLAHCFNQVRGTANGVTGAARGSRLIPLFLLQPRRRQWGSTNDCWKGWEDSASWWVGEGGGGTTTPRNWFIFSRMAEDLDCGEMIDI